MNRIQKHKNALYQNHSLLRRFMGFEALRILVVCCLICLSIAQIACSDTEQRNTDSQLQKKPLKSAKKHNELTLIMGGDALLHSQVYKDAQYSLSAQINSVQINPTQDSMNQKQAKHSHTKTAMNPNLAQSENNKAANPPKDSQTPKQEKQNPQERASSNTTSSKIDSNTHATKDSQTTQSGGDSQAHISKSKYPIHPQQNSSLTTTQEGHNKDSQTPNATPKQSAQFEQPKQSKPPKQAATIGYDFSKMFVNLAPIIKQYDLAFYNQETILGGTELGLSSYPTFNSPQEFGDCMISLGFNLISLANNHTLDRGIKAIENSYQYWQDKPVLTAGSYISFEQRNTPQIRQKNGITYTMLAYTYGTNGIPIPKGKEYLVNVYTKEMLAEDIARVRDKVDLLIVSMHWGDEYVFTPTKEQESFARYLAELGVDIVIGNHPHVIQPIERIGKTLVIYSLGNMISAQNGLERRVGMLAGVQVKKDTKSGAISLHDVHANLIYTYSDSNRRNFILYPFALLNESVLPNYEQIYQQYSQIVTKRDSQIRMIPLESTPKNTEK